MSPIPNSERTPAAAKPGGGSLRWLWIVALIAVIAIAGVVFLLLLSGGEGEPTLTFDGTAVTYSGPETLEAGDVTFTLENTSDEDATFAWGLIRDDSVTLEDEIAWMEANPDYKKPPWLGTWSDIGRAEPGEVVEKATRMIEGRAELTAWRGATGYVAVFIDVTGN